ncbi:MAG: BatA domain-containing protein [Saprospiraceae bacterium]
MLFLYPLFLVAGLTLGIPIILHLFYFRRFKRVYFTNVRFLREVQEETSARARLRNLLVLLMRLLAFLFLVFAFAQPFLAGKEAGRKGLRAVSVFVDNSFSMSGLSEDVPLVEQAKSRAREVVRSYGLDDRFQVLTNDFSGSQQRLLSKEDALAAIDDIALSSDSRKLSAVLERQRQALATAPAADPVAYWISDFQSSAADLGVYRDTTLELNLIPLQPVRLRNVGIDSAWFESPLHVLGQTAPLYVKVRNYSEEAAENIRLTLDYEGQAKPVGVLDIPAGSSIVDTVNVTMLRSGWQRATLSLTDYPVQFDDRYHLAFSVAEKIQVLVAGEGAVNRYLEAAIRGMPQFELTAQNSQALSYSRFPEFQMIVLDELAVLTSGLAAELKRYAEAGGSTLLFPDRNVRLEAFGEFMGTFGAGLPMGFDTSARAVGEINMEEFVFRDVFDNKSSNLRLPSVRGSFRLSRSAGIASADLMLFRDGSPFLTRHKVGGGNLFVCAAPLDEAYSNLSANAEIFVPMLYKMAISGGGSRRIAFTIGRDELLEARHTMTLGGEMKYKIRGEREEFIPEQRISGNTAFLGVYDQIREAGIYGLFLQRDSVLADFAFNYDRSESQLTYLEESGLKEKFGPLANIIVAKDEAVLAAKIEARSQGMGLWWWCILLVLIFLGIETILLRFWRV